jgi:hypothetical protein
MHLSLSCNAVMYKGFDASKEEVTQAGKVPTTDDVLMGLDYDPQNELGNYHQPFFLQHIT